MATRPYTETGAEGGLTAPRRGASPSRPPRRESHSSLMWIPAVTCLLHRGGEPQPLRARAGRRPSARCPPALASSHPRPRPRAQKHRRTSSSATQAGLSAPWTSRVWVSLTKSRSPGLSSIASEHDTVPQALPREHRMDEPDSVEAVVDRHRDGFRRPGDLIAVGGQGEEEQAVDDRRAEDRVGCSLRVDMDPLTVARGGGEPIDLVLCHLRPDGHEDLSSDVLLSLLENGCCRHGAESPLARQTGSSDATTSKAVAHVRSGV